VASKKLGLGIKNREKMVHLTARALLNPKPSPPEINKKKFKKNTNAK
jgi:hypothetical protein